MTRCRLPAAFLLTAFVVPLLAQDGYESIPPAPLVVTAVWYAEDEVFQKELKLTPAQVKDLVAARKKSSDFYYRSTPKECVAGADKENKALAATIKTILSPEQFARAEQLAAQIAWADPNWAVGDTPLLRTEELDLTRIPGTALFYSPELAAALKLTAEQKKLVTDGSGEMGESGGIVYLTPAQTAAAKTFLGPIVKHTWTQTPDPAFEENSLHGPSATPLWRTAARDVRAAIGMTEDQAKELAPIRERWQNARRESLSPEKQAQRGKELTAEADKELARVLKPEQLTRLKQIDFQLQMRNEPRPEGAPFTHPVAVKALAVAPEQQKAHDAAQKAFAEAVGAAVKADAGFDATDRAIKTAAAARDKALAAILTAEQTKKLADLRGAPFTGNANPDRAGPGGFDSGRKGVDARVLRELSFGRYALELQQLSRNGSIHTELKLTPEQIKKAIAAHQDQLQKFPTAQLNNVSDVETGTKLYEERSKFVEQALGEILTPEQAKRFHEIMIQEREQSRGGFVSQSRPIPSAVSYPGVAEAVKLTAEQKKKLLDGTPPATVLTDEQKAAVKSLRGEPFKGMFSTTKGNNPWSKGPDSGFGTPPPAPEITAELRQVRELTFGRYALELSQLARSEPIQTDLKLTPEQIKKATATYQDQLQKFPARDLNLARSDPEKATKLYEERSKFVEKALDEILTADQAKRFREIMIQLREQPVFGSAPDPTTVAAAAAYPGVAEALKLTAEQRKRLIDGASGLAVLTDEQRTAVRNMRGELVKGLALGPPPSGVPGGFGGPGGGMGGSRAQDPEQSWTFLQRLTGSTGETVDLSKIPPQTHAFLKSATERTGGIPLPESGTMTKAAYFEYHARNEATRAATNGTGGVLGPRGEHTPRLRELTFGRFVLELRQLSRNESIQTDLKLTPEQIKKATATYTDQFQKFPDRDLNAPTDVEKATKLYEEQSKFVEKALGEILTPEQAKRFRQIMLQERELATVSTPASFSTVLSAVSYPGATEAVKLTAEQKKKLTDGAAPSTVLTDEQRAAIKPLLGEPFKGTFSTDPRSGAGGNPWAAGPGGPPTRRTPLSQQARLVLALPWDALVLTPEQVEKLVPAITRLQVATLWVPVPDQPRSFRGPDEQKLSEARAAFTKEIEALLTPEQTRRVEQLLLQRRAAASLVDVLKGAAAESLKLTPAQLQRLSAADEDLTRIARLVPAAGLPDDVTAELSLVLRNRLDDRVLAFLTPEQKAAWQKLTGAPFSGFRKRPLTGDSGTTTTTTSTD